MTYKKGDWVKIKEDGRIAQVVAVGEFDDGIYALEIDGVLLCIGGTCVYLTDEDLEQAPKTWATLQVGDVLLDGDGDERKVLGIIGEIVFPSMRHFFDNTSSNYAKKELQNYGYTIKSSTPDTSEEITITSAMVGKTVRITK